MNWGDKSVLLIGGTGSFGSNFIKFIMEHNKPKVIRVFSRDEHKQTQLLDEYGGIKGNKSSELRGFIGDIRDKERLSMAMEGIDIVIHAAALKQVQSCEYNPFETLKTNVLGAQNVIQCALDHNVEKVLAISTDKAVAPLNLYGASKLCMERLMMQANAYRGTKRTKFACTRYGNVADSRGTVVHIWKANKINKEPIRITNMNATRFWITMKEANRFVMECVEDMDYLSGGEIFSPMMPSVKVSDLRLAIAGDQDFCVIGERIGDKLHEDLILKEELKHTIMFRNKYVILPEDVSWPYKVPTEFNTVNVRVEENLTSGNNSWFLKPEQIRETLEAGRETHSFRDADLLKTA